MYTLYLISVFVHILSATVWVYLDLDKNLFRSR